MNEYVFLIADREVDSEMPVLKCSKRKSKRKE